MPPATAPPSTQFRGRPNRRVVSGAGDTLGAVTMFTEVGEVLDPEDGTETITGSEDDCAGWLYDAHKLGSVSCVPSEQT